MFVDLRPVACGACRAGSVSRAVPPFRRLRRRERTRPPGGRGRFRRRRAPLAEPAADGTSRKCRVASRPQRSEQIPPSSFFRCSSSSASCQPASVAAPPLDSLFLRPFENRQGLPAGFFLGLLGLAMVFLELVVDLLLGLLVLVLARLGIALKSLDDLVCEPGHNPLPGPRYRPCICRPSWLAERS